MWLHRGANSDRATARAGDDRTNMGSSALAVLGAVGLVAVIGYQFIGISVLCDEYLCPALDEVGPCGHPSPCRLRRPAAPSYGWMRTARSRALESDPLSPLSSAAPPTPSHKPAIATPQQAQTAATATAQVCEKLKMPRSLAGATLVAFGSSAPEVGSTTWSGDTWRIRMPSLDEPSE